MPQSACSQGLDRKRLNSMPASPAGPGIPDLLGTFP